MSFHLILKKTLQVLIMLLIAGIAKGQVQSQNENAFQYNDEVVQLPSGTSSSLFALCSTDVLTLYAAGSGGTIIKSIDGGKSWKTLLSGTSETLWSLFFTNARTGYAAGSNGTILKTTNAGFSWTQMNSSTNSELKCIYFTDAMTGYAAGIYGTLLKTSDGGTSWQKLPVETDKWLKDIFFTSKSTGYVCGWGGNIFKTKDSGTSWELLESTTPKILESIYFPSASEGYAAGWGGTVIKTMDDGESWSFMSLPNTNDLTDLCMMEADHFIVTGYSNTILTTANGGEDWRQINTNCAADFFDIVKTGDDAVLIAGSGGKLIKITLADKKQEKELKKNWAGKEDAYKTFNSAEECYAKKEYEQALIMLDSATSLLGKDNESIQELRIKCLYDNRNYASANKEIEDYLHMKPDTSGDYYKQLYKFSDGIEKKIADETDWKKALADSTSNALDEYIKEHPAGIFKNEAKDEMLWMKAKSKKSPEGYDDYLKQQQDGKHITDADELRTYYLAIRDNNTQMLESYLTKFPNGKFIHEVSDTLMHTYLRMGDEGLQRRSPEEAEQWFMRYQQSFSGNDTTDIIKNKMEEVSQLRKEIAEEQVKLQMQQQKDKMKNDLKWEKNRRDMKLLKAGICTAITLGSAYGAYSFFHQGNKLAPALICSGIGLVGVFVAKNAFRDAYYHQLNVHKIKKDIGQMNISAITDPMNNIYGMTLHLKF